MTDHSKDRAAAREPLPEACACESCQDAAWPQAKGHDAATKRPFQGLPRKTLEALYMGALETITELETKVVNEITNEPGTSWEITDGNLHIRVAS